MNPASPKTLFKRVWTEYISKHTLWLFVAVLLMVIEGSSFGLLAYYIQPMFDEIFSAHNPGSLTPISLAIFGIFIARSLGGFGQRSMTIRIGLRVITDIQKSLLKHLLTLDNNFYSQNSPGALIERVRGDSQSLQSIASNVLMTLGRDSVSLVSLLAVAIYIDWQWTLMAFVGAPILVLPVVMVQRLIRASSRSARQTSAEISTRLDEIFHGIKAIKLNNTQRYESDRFKTEVNRYLKVQSKAEYGKAGLPAMIDLVAGFGFVGVMIFGANEIINGEKTVGEFMSFFMSLGLIFDPIRRLSNVSGQLQSALASLERVYGLFNELPLIKNQENAKPLTQPSGDIRFDNVNFAYGEKQVLKNLNFIAPAGKITALVGPSGAGKTTVFNLITRIEDPASGVVSIGGQSLIEADLNQLREQISVVSQESALFDESIRQNIAFGKLSAEDDEITLAAKTALVEEFSELFPEKLESLAGPRGSRLSGGQRQRVVIARALLRDAPILLLDEATSALDAKTEFKIQQALETASKGRTTLVIAHRLSTIRNADLIHVMQDGEVVESGTHDELIVKKGAYANFHKTLEQ